MLIVDILRNSLYLIALLPNILWAQSIINQPISGNYHDITIVEFLEILEGKYGVSFYYHPTKIPYYQQSHTFDGVPLYKALGAFLEGSNLDIIKYNNDIVIVNKYTATREDILDLKQKWDDGVFTKPISDEPEYLDLYFGDSLQFETDPFTLSGFVLDSYSGDPVVGAVIRDKAKGLGTASDENGYYTLLLTPGTHHYTVSYLGYQDIELRLRIYQSYEQNFDMKVHALNLSEVVVEASVVQNKVAETQIGVELISMSDVKELPSFLGEADILQSIQQLPGVSTAGEASSGFNVRGGNIDQNLVLLDDALIFNANHALGLFSVFNTDAVRNATLHKGGIPAQFGGRLSSVLQVELKDGNPKKWRGSGGVGLASARLVMDGPLTSNTGLLVGLRSSYSNWLLRQGNNPNIRGSRVYFGDGIVKISRRFSDKHTISGTGYLSHDFFQLNDEFGYDWSTRFIDFKWRYLIGNQLSLSTSFVSSGYDSHQFVPEGSGAFEIATGINYQKIKSNLSFQNDRHFINTGVEGMQLQMHPEKIGPYHPGSVIDSKEINRDKALEISIYVNDEINLNPFLSISAGLRFTRFLSLGPSSVFNYDRDDGRTVASTSDISVFSKNEVIQTYSGLEPRVALNLRLNTSQSIKISYNYLKQYIHLLSNTASATPVDIWQLANVHLKPQTAHNYSAGFFINDQEEWEISLEAFYKDINNLTQFRDLATLLVNEQIETEITQGKAKTYGIELGVEKKSGKWTTNMAYTFSRSQARTESAFPEEIINSNRWYYAPFDQPHQFNIQAKRQINPVQQLQFGFVFKSGRPITVPVAGYGVQNIIVTHFSDRNTFRVPAYHRLDFGYTLNRSKTKTKGLRSSFTLSLYNLYARKNAYTIYFKRDSRNIQRAYKLSILGATFPSLTWNFTF